MKEGGLDNSRVCVLDDRVCGSLSFAYICVLMCRDVSLLKTICPESRQMFVDCRSLGPLAYITRRYIKRYMLKQYYPLAALPREFAEVVSWIEEICRGGITMYALCDHKEKDNRVIFYLFTKNYKYNIAVRPNSFRHETVEAGKIIGASNEPSYLGCTVQARKPRAGEDWTRGNDLPDGRYSYETWQRIKNAMLAYELVKVAAKPAPTPETPNELKDFDKPSLNYKQ